MVAIYRANRLPPHPGKEKPNPSESALSVDARLFIMLVQAAETGDPCPLNREIADRLGLSQPNKALPILARLIDAKFITVERFAAARVVTITVTGKSTARPAKETPHWRSVE